MSIDKKTIRRCNCIIAVHEGHQTITELVAKEFPESLKEECCGGVMLFNFCPLCGKDVRNIIKEIKK